MLDLNLIPTPQRAAPRKAKFSPAATTAMLLISGVLPLAALQVIIHMRSNELERITSESQALQPRLKQRAELLNNIKTQQEVIELARTISSAKQYRVNDLNEVFALLGEHVTLKSASFKSLSSEELNSRQEKGFYLGRNITREINLEGSVNNEHADTVFRAIENDTNVDLDLRTIQIEKDNTSFSLSVGLTGPTSTPGNATTDPAAPSGTPPSADQSNSGVVQ